MQNYSLYMFHSTTMSKNIQSIFKKKYTAKQYIHLSRKKKKITSKEGNHTTANRIEIIECEKTKRKVKKRARFSFIHDPPLPKIA